MGAKPFAVLLFLAAACGSGKAEPDRPVVLPPDAAPVIEPRIDRVAAAIDQLDRKIATLRAGLAKHSADIADAEWVKKKLATMVEVDQLVRNALMMPPNYSKGEHMQFQQAVVARLTRIDRRNTRSLDVIVKRHGWITIDRFGKQASANAWLLAQHADHDRAFQKRVLALLEPLAKTGKVRPADYAYLYDRVASAESRPQRYGTQGRCVGPKRWEPNPIEDASNVDQRRSEVGLPGMDEYKRRFVDICR